MSGIDSSVPATDAALVNLSVHSLPSPDAAAALRRTARGRWLMIAVLLVCAAPVVASYVAYFVVRPQARTNYGELIDPPRPLPAALPLQNDAGTPVAPLALRGPRRWPPSRPTRPPGTPASRRRRCCVHPALRWLGG